MSYSIIPIALAVTLIVIALFSLVMKRPPRGLALFFLLVFLVIWSGHFWITPYGPVLWGVAWIPLVFLGFLFAFFVAALSAGIAPSSNDPEKEDGPVIAAGFFFWILLMILIAAIGFGYYKEYNLLVNT